MVVVLKLEKVHNLTDIDYPYNNLTIPDAYSKCKSILDKKKYKKIMVSISGGADSDIVLDMVYKLDVNNKCDYVFFDTGLEYDATKNHIKYLEEKYGIEIRKVRPQKNIVISIREVGQPFLSKYISNQIEALQNMGFEWEDTSFEESIVKYFKEVEDYELIEKFKNKDTKNTTFEWVDGKLYNGRGKGALKWWYNGFTGSSSYDIANRKYLKEFMIKNPPNFKISGACCKFVKKDTSAYLMKQEEYDMVILGVRKYEGGIRALAYTGCFVEEGSKYRHALYMPLFWFTEKDKQIYNTFYEIRNSDMYRKYGYTRTGCCGCPYAGAKEINKELKAMKVFEPNRYVASKNIFGESYTYSKKYYLYTCKKKKRGQIKKEKWKN